MNEIKRDRFIRVMTNRVTKILDAISILGNCADHRQYDYTPDMVDTAFQSIVERLNQVRSVFDLPEGRERFSLSDPGRERTTYYCVCEQRGPENPGEAPCPDSDRCRLCGKQNPEQQPVSVLLTRGEWTRITEILKGSSDGAVLAEKIKTKI